MRSRTTYLGMNRPAAISHRIGIIVFVPLALFGIVFGFIANAIAAGFTFGWGVSEEILHLGSMQYWRPRE